MLADEYLKWVEYHSRAFGLRPADAAGMADWRDAFIAGNYTVAELVLATKRMLLENPAPAFLNEHLTRINEHVRIIKADLRAEFANRQLSRDPVEAERSRCTLCDDGGFIVSPHPKFVRMGEWIPSHHNAVGMAVRPTAAIKCSCAAGRAKGGKLMTLEQYKTNIHEDPVGLMNRNKPVAPPTAPTAVVRQVTQRMIG